MTMTTLCKYLKNWFVRARYFGSFVISGGVCTFADGAELPLFDGQYYYIDGSMRNDGVHRYADDSETLKDEFFDGSVWVMAVPDDIERLVSEIDSWQARNEKALGSPFQSETYTGGSYSYSLKSGAGTYGAASPVMTWQLQFEAELKPWRKI